MTEHEKDPAFDKLENRIREARSRENLVAGRTSREPNPGLALGMRLAIEFVAGVVVGVGIGFAIDHFLGTRPWFMVLFLLLGGAAGVMNAYRAGKGMDATVGLGAAKRRQAERQKDR